MVIFKLEWNHISNNTEMIPVYYFGRLDLSELEFKISFNSTE